MHIPDGLMDPMVWILGFVLVIIPLVLAFRRLGLDVDEEKLPVMAVLAAGIFAAQMLNFPVIGGTSGHLIGAALAVVLVGPWAAMAILTVVIIIQSLFFGDGGVTALGLNLLNMAVIAPLVAGGVYWMFKGRNERTVIFAASWMSVFVSACAVALQLSLSFVLSGGLFGVTPFVSFPFMLSYHALIGIGEGIITIGIWTFISHVAPEMLKSGRPVAREAV